MSTHTLRNWMLPLFAAVLITFAGRTAAAQDVVPAPDPRPSPMAVAQATFSDGTYVVVRYGSPRMRGREIFGGLVPFGEVWRLGANEATEMTVTEDVEFGNVHLPAGTYALFAIPNEQSWTIVVNEALGQWGAFSYSEEHDVARFDVPVERSDQIHEAFTINLDTYDDESGADLTMVWDQTRVTVPIRQVQ